MRFIFAALISRRHAVADAATGLALATWASRAARGSLSMAVSIRAAKAIRNTASSSTCNEQLLRLMTPSNAYANIWRATHWDNIRSPGHKFGACRARCRELLVASSQYRAEPCYRCSYGSILMERPVAQFLASPPCILWDGLPASHRS